MKNIVCKINMRAHQVVRSNYPYSMGMETIFEQDPIYTFGDNGLEPILLEVIPFLGGQPYRHRRVPIGELVALFRSALARGSPSTAFYLAVLVLTASEPEQRKMIQQKSNKRLRSIKFGGKSIPEYLRDELDPDYEARKWTKGDYTMEEDFDRLVAGILEPVKKELNMPSGDPMACSYPISDAVIASASDPECRLFLESLATAGPVYEGQIDDLNKKLSELFPNDSKAVSRVLQSGKTREHLSAISFSDKVKEARITIVNPKGLVLSFPALKLEALLTVRDKTTLLGVIGARDFDSGKAVVEFNSPLVKGEVVGRYESCSSTLHVVGLNESNRDVAFSAQYILDPDTLLCHYLSRRRQRLDRIRFETLLELADTCVPVDPFRHLDRK